MQNESWHSWSVALLNFDIGFYKYSIGSLIFNLDAMPISNKGWKYCAVWMVCVFVGFEQFKKMQMRMQIQIENIHWISIHSDWFGIDGNESVLAIGPRFYPRSVILPTSR